MAYAEACVIYNVALVPMLLAGGLQYLPITIDMDGADMGEVASNDVAECGQDDAPKRPANGSGPSSKRPKKSGNNFPTGVACLRPSAGVCWCVACQKKGCGVGGSSACPFAWWVCGSKAAPAVWIKCLPVILCPLCLACAGRTGAKSERSRKR